MAETQSDDAKLEFTSRWPIFADQQRKENTETGFDMVPQSRREKLVCMIAANLTGRSFDDLYERKAYGDVVEELALAIAGQYTPPREPETKGPT